jgi:bile acid-coenzyme A ligase
MSESSIGTRLAQIAAANPDRIALSIGDEAISRKGLEERSNQMARALADHGVRFGDLVTLALPNGIEFAICAFALWKLGATPQPISWRIPSRELNAVVELADSRLVIGVEPGSVPGRRCLPSGGLSLVGVDNAPVEDRVAPTWKAPTSGGTTGAPKLIISGDPGIWLPDVADLWRIPADGEMTMPAPLYHNAPFITTFIGILSGAHVAMLPRFDAVTTLDLVELHRSQWIYLVPTMMSRIWHLGETERSSRDLSSLETVWHLAAPCPPWLKDAWISWMGPSRIWELYAGTESQAITVLDGNEWLSHRGSVGRAVTGEIRILGDDAREAPVGSVGEIYMRRSPGTPPTYRYVGAEPREHRGWESLGDLGRIDNDGYLYLSGRTADVIISGGANIYAAEVEAALLEHPGVMSCTVIGQPDDDLGERVHGIVHADPDVRADMLLDHLTERLARYKIPRSFTFSDTPVRDDAGKVRLADLQTFRTDPEPPSRQQ